MNIPLLEAQTRKLRSKLEEIKESKCLELVELLNNHHETVMLYDWYHGIDPDLNIKIFQYFIVSRKEINSIELDNGKILDDFDPENYYGYLKYLVLSKVRISKIITADKVFTLRRP